MPADQTTAVPGTAVGGCGPGLPSTEVLAFEVLARRSEHGGPSREVLALRAIAALPGTKALMARFAP